MPNPNYNGTALSPAHIGDEANASLDPVKAQLTVGAEAANAIPITIQMLDASGKALRKATRVHLRLYSAAMIEALAAAYTMAASTGTEVSTTAQAALVVDTNALGQAVVAVTDVAGTSTDQLFLEAKPLDVPGATVLTSLTFT